MSWGLRAVSWFLYGFLYAPLIIVGIYSFNQASYGTAWTGFTWHWYEKVFQNELVLTATLNTIILALSSTLISTILGTTLGYGLYRYDFPSKALFKGILYLPIVVPDIILAISLLLFYKIVRQYTGLFELNLLTMMLGHITFQLAFVAITVRARLLTLNPVLEEAANDLYASPWEVLRYITFPLALPGIIAGALIAFTLSLDDFVVSFFTSGPESQTLPMLIYTTVRRGMTPDMHALSTLMFLVTVILVIFTTYIQQPRR
jgi:spermidine/putrescine transport system permease protein